MKRLLATVLIICMNSVHAADANKSLPRSSPESQGVSSAGVLRFVESADKDIPSFHSFMLVRHGKVVTEGWWAPYDAETRHELYSLSKSFTSTAIGMAIAEGQLSLDDRVTKFFPSELPDEASPMLKAMRVRDLLSMSTGHESEPRLGVTETWTKTFLSHNVTKEPGSHFLYNTPATYMLSAILQKQTGQTTREFLKPRLFAPLGIQDPTWGTSPQGVSLGGYGLSVRTEDIAKFGQLYLQHGKWNDQQLVSPEWIAQATSKQVSNGSNPDSDWNQGYGFQFWRCRHGAYRGDGAFGQYCIVMPQQDAVVAITSGVKDMQAVLNLVWDKLLPAIEKEALPVNQTAEQQLKEKLAKLVLPLQSGKATSTNASRNLSGSFQFEKNAQQLESVRLEAGPDGKTYVIMKYAGRELRLECSPEAWKKGVIPFGTMPIQTIATCGAWTSDDEFTMKACLVETPFCLTTRFQFQGEELMVDSESNVGFGQTKWDQLVGKRTKGQ